MLMDNLTQTIFRRKIVNISTYKKAMEHFKKVDPDFYKQIKRLRIETVKPKKNMTPDAYLVRSIISQQISTKAAASILKKFLNLFPGEEMSHVHLASLTDEELRGAGLSRGKTIYIRDLSQRFLKGELPDHASIKKMSDEEIIEAFVKVKGVGVWTVQMLLIFFLRRKDVFPIGDLGVQKGYQKIFNKRKLPNKKEMEKRGAKWAPYRSVAALYLWCVVDTK
jgi:3-methyladenine DNA glycosylase/8-oxoguanine DNA glycosylase